MTTRICLYCGSGIENKHGKAKFCSPNHRVYYFKFGPKMSTELDGLVLQISHKLQDIDSEIEKMRIGKILEKVLHDLSQPPLTEVPTPSIKNTAEHSNMSKDSLAALFRQDMFGDDKFLDVEKYTKYPISQRPDDKVKRAIFDLQKKKSDDEIREAWKNRSNNISKP